MDKSPLEAQSLGGQGFQWGEGHKQGEGLQCLPNIPKRLVKSKLLLLYSFHRVQLLPTLHARARKRVFFHFRPFN